MTKDGVMGKVSTLAEVKVLLCCLTRYPRVPWSSEKAVNRRAGQLPGEYLRKARRMDREFGNVPNTDVGPVEAKLATFDFKSWVYGA